jgi:hypothetical protein
VTLALDVSRGAAVAERRRSYGGATVADRHLQAMLAADLIWLHGYGGISTAMELGLAYGHRRRVFAATKPADVALRPGCDS